MNHATSPVQLAASVVITVPMGLLGPFSSPRLPASVTVQRAVVTSSPVLFLGGGGAAAAPAAAAAAATVRPLPLAEARLHIINA